METRFGWIAYAAAACQSTGSRETLPREELQEVAGREGQKEMFICLAPQVLAPAPFQRVARGISPISHQVPAAGWAWKGSRPCPRSGIVPDHLSWRVRLTR